MVGLLVAALAAPLGAQLPRIGVPKGQLRLEIGSQFDAANDEILGGTRPLQDRWNGALGPGLDGNLSVTQSLIQSLMGGSGYALSAGRSHINAATTVGTANLSAALGLTDRISLYGTLPFVRARWQTRLTLDSTSANVGFNPANSTFTDGSGAGSVTAFLTQFQAALAALETKINNGDYDTNATTKNQAIAALANGNALEGAFNSLYNGANAVFVPLAGSAAGTAIAGTVTALQSTLTSLNVGGFTAAPVFASTRLTDAQYQGYLTNGAGPVVSLFRGDQFIQRQGDLEVGINYTVVDRPALRVAATGAVRFPTGLIDRSENFFDLGTGTGVWGFIGRVAADVTRGRLGARLSGGYDHRGTLDREWRPSLTPIADQSLLANVSIDEGDVITLGFEPFYRLAPGFALALGALHESRGADVMTLVPTGTTLTGAAPSTGRTALQAGLTYSSFAGITGKGTPVEAQWYFREVVAASGGAVDKTRTMWMAVRVYYKVW